MQEKTFKRTLSVNYVYIVFFLSLFSFLIGTGYEHIFIVYRILVFLVILATISYIYFSMGKITVSQAGIRIGLKLIAKEKIIYLKIYEEFQKGMGNQTYLDIRYRVGKIEGNDIRVNLSSYNEEMVEDELRKWSKENKVNFSVKKVF